MGSHKRRPLTRTFVAWAGMLSLSMSWAPALAAQQNPADEPHRKDVTHWLSELEKRMPEAPVNATKSGPTKAGGSLVATCPPLGGPAGKGSASQGEEARISVDFYKIDLHNVFRLLGQVSGKNIVVDESVKGTLTLALQDVPWTFVLDVIKNLKNLSSIERYNTIMIFPSDKKVTWGGEAAAKGEGALDVQAQPLIVTPAEQGLEVTETGKAKLPIDVMIQAEKLVREGANEEKKGNISAALETYKKASDLWTDNLPLAKKVAILALAREHDELTALNYGKKALRIDPKDSEAASLVGVALARMGKAQDARIYFERAMSADPIPYTTLYNYAVFTFSQGQYRDTLHLINKMEMTYPLTVDVMLLKAQAFEGLGQYDQARREYDAVVHAGQGVPSDALSFAEQKLQALPPGK